MKLYSGYVQGNHTLQYVCVLCESFSMLPLRLLILDYATVAT